MMPVSRRNKENERETSVHVSLHFPHLESCHNELLCWLLIELVILKFRLNNKSLVYAVSAAQDMYS